MTASPILPISPAGEPDALVHLAGGAPIGASGRPGAFGQMLLDGVQHVNQKLTDAETLSTKFALDDSVPLHQVTFALQEARLSLEFMLQVRTRLVDAYQQFAGMQL